MRYIVRFKDDSDDLIVETEYMITEDGFCKFYNRYTTDASYATTLVAINEVKFIKTI